MSPRAGVELTPTHLRAVLASPWRDAAVRTLEVPWNPLLPIDGVTALRQSLGTVESVSLAVGLGLLQVKRVELPPVSVAEREQMVALEGERFFAASEPLVSALAPGGAVAFAAPAAWLDAWTAAFESWAPVVRVDPTPVALARALGHQATGDYAVDAGVGERGFVSLTLGQVQLARRIPAALPGPEGGPLPDVKGRAGQWAAALGTLQGADEGEAGTLASPDRRRVFQSRRRSRLATAVVAAMAGMAFAALAFDRSRERTLHALEADIASLRGGAAAGTAALASRAQLNDEVARLARGVGAGAGALGPLTAISALLPRDAVILSATATGRDWQIDGTAGNAAALIPLLDGDRRFEKVRPLSASSRFRDGPRTRETFSIAFRVRSGA